MRLDLEHQEFVTAARDALTEWRAVTARPADGHRGAYQVYDYPPVPGATAFLFYWPASIEITFAGYLPPELGTAKRHQIDFVTHMSRLLGHLGFPVEVHGPKDEHGFVALEAGAAVARLHAVARVVGANRGHLLIGLAEDNRRGNEPEEPDDEPAAADDDADDAT